jgi:hypothetical protein
MPENERDDALTSEDLALLAGIIEAHDDPRLVAHRIFAYYHDDPERAARTPRPTMYLHMGMLAGSVLGVMQRAAVPTVRRQ